MNATVCELTCLLCTDWRDVVAHPGPAPGSMRICAQGHETYSGTWKPCWRPRTGEQIAEAAHDAGRLF